MDVILLSCTPNPEKIVAIAARLCYSNKSPLDLYTDLTDKEIEKLINIVTSNGHLSTLEHATFTFGVSDISRACTHQLVRHRMASYNQQSQRYVDLSKDQNTILPKSILSSEEAKSEYLNITKIAHEGYSKLVKMGIPKEDARYLLPNSYPSNIIVTMNARELMHFFEVRCCNRSQWEIRDLAWKMLKICKSVAPRLFKYSGPKCMFDKCPEGNMSCGNPYKSN